MQASTLNCLMCGAPTRCDSPNCAHCGARLATVACPSCFGMIFQGSRFCPHCGTGVQATAPRKTDLPCPKCKKKLGQKQVGGTDVHECARCHGLWIEAAAFERICVDREKQSLALGTASQTFVPGQRHPERKIRYVPCPACAALMQRVNFAKCSGVIVDICKGHGTWFDRDELHHIVDFIHKGGLDLARQKEKAQAEAALKRLQGARRDAALANTWHSRPYEGGFAIDEPDLFSMAGSLISAILR